MSADPASHLALPEQEPWLGMLLLAGSSGRVLADRADVLARHGIATLATTWFGGDGQPASPRRVPLDALLPHLDHLASLAPELGVMGTSYGAEAALLLGVKDGRIRLVVGQAPSAYLWQTPDLTATGDPIDDAKWMWYGEPIPGIPYIRQTQDREWPDARRVHEASVEACREPQQFAIPVDRIDAEVIVVSGGDDRVWQADVFAREIVASRGTDLPTEHLHLAEAGHQVTLPGEPPAPPRPSFPRGGTPEADAALGSMLLDAIVARREAL